MILVSVAAYTDSKVLRKLISDLDDVVVKSGKRVKVLVIFDRPYSAKHRYYNRYLPNRRVTIIFKKKSRGETDSINLAVDYARKNGFEIFLHLDDDIGIDKSNFLKIIDELKLGIKIVSAKMVRLTNRANCLIYRMNLVNRKILDVFIPRAHYVDGRFFAIRTSDVPQIPENLNSDHYLTLCFQPEEIKITPKTTASFISACNFGSYCRSHVKYRINTLKIKKLYPDLYRYQLEITRFRLGDKITGIPLDMINEVYKHLTLSEKMVYCLDRFLAWMIKNYTFWVFSLQPEKYLTTTSWKTEIDQKVVSSIHGPR